MLMLVCFGASIIWKTIILKRQRKISQQQISTLRITKLEEIQTMPENPQIYYYQGIASETNGDLSAAHIAYRKAIADEEKINSWSYFKAQSLLKLGHNIQAKEIFEGLLKEGEKRLSDAGETDFFMKFGTGASRKKSHAQAQFLIGLGKLGLHSMGQAEMHFKRSTELDVYDPWAKALLLHPFSR